MEKNQLTGFNSVTRNRDGCAGICRDIKGFTGIIPLEKCEIAGLLGISMRELARELGPALLEKMGWRMACRQKILPKHFPAIHDHFFGTSDGWEDFFRRKA